MFAAFCVRETQWEGPHIGFTCPRALGKAVVRNRIKRRVREAVGLTAFGEEGSVRVNVPGDVTVIDAEPEQEPPEEAPEDKGGRAIRETTGAAAS